MRKPIRIISGAVALLVTLGVAGCVGIPTSGTVHGGDPLSVEEDLPLDFLPSGPAKGASQQDILLGFVDAALSPQGDFSKAHEFLSASFSNAWKPLKNVTIYQGAPEVTLVNDSTAQLSVTPVAEVDAAGQYSEVASSAPITTEYGFVKQGGEWRINRAPDGILLERINFDQVFSDYPLYFFDPTYTYLVPDLRWFPARDFPSTRIVKAVLQGPSAWLSGGNAVVSAFPAGTALSADTVPVIGRDARVDLNSEALNADPVTWQRMQLQLAKSLGAVSSVSSVTISVNQNENETQELPIAAPRVDARPLVYKDGVFGFLSTTNDNVEQIPGISEQVEQVAPVAATLGAGQKAAAVLGRDGVYAIRTPQTTPVLVDGRPGLISPTMDPLGFVWSVPATSPGDIVVYDTGNTPHPVEATWPEATTIVSLDVSRDGARVLALLNDNGVARMVTAAIIRNGAHVPVKLGEPVELTTGAGAPVDATWINELNVMSMTRTADGEDQLMVQQIGGPSSSRGRTSDGVSIVGGNTFSSVRILAKVVVPTHKPGEPGESGEDEHAGPTGVLLSQRGTAWQATSTGISFLATQLGSSQVSTAGEGG